MFDTAGGFGMWRKRQYRSPTVDGFDPAPVDLWLIMASNLEL